MKKIIIALLFIFTFLYSCCYATSVPQDLKELKIDMKINKDGSASVTEEWKVEILNSDVLRTKLFFNDLDFENISDIKVYKIANNITTEIKSGDFSGDYSGEDITGAIKENNFYFLESGDSPCLVAAIGKYSDVIISYKINDIITLYDDCAELEVDIFAKDITSKKTNLNIYYPIKASSMDNIYMWEYYNGENSEVTITDLEKINISDSDNKFKNRVGLKILMPDDMFEDVQNTVNRVALNRIVKEERDIIKKAISKKAFKQGAFLFIEGIILVFLLYKTFAYIEESGKIFPKKKEEKVKYFKELPYDGITPGQAAFIKDINFIKLGNVFAASLLNLKVKGVIDFVYIGNEKIFENVFIKILKDNPELAVEEKAVYEFLIDYLKKFQKEDKLISLNILQRYISHSKGKVNDLKKSMDNAIKFSIPFYDDKANKNIKKKLVSMIIYMVLLIVMLIIHKANFDVFSLYTWIYFLAIMDIIQCANITFKTSVFNEKGNEYREKLKALERYMIDFSTFKNEGVPEISVWEYYIVYAEAFGISKKVLEQISACYPNIYDTGFIEMYEVCQYLEKCDFGKSFFMPKT